MNDQDDATPKPPDGEPVDSPQPVIPENDEFEGSLKKSTLDIFRTYPLSYLRSQAAFIQVTNFITYNNQNIVEGDNIAGVVGDKGEVRAGTVQVNYTDTNKPVIQPEKSTTPKFDSAQSIDNWFFLEKEIDNQIHLLVVGLFAGNTYRFVTSVREQLKLSLGNPKEGNKDVESGIPPLVRSNSTILEKTGSQIVDFEFTVESGKTHLKVIDFIDPEYQSFVLDFLRSSVDLLKIRTQIEHLLIQICRLDGIDIHSLGTPLIDLTRSQAAIGLGELAKSDYEYFLSRIIRPWANSPDPFLRFLVGWVLFALATDESHRSRIISLLTHWSKSKNIFLEWTAAAACSRLGLIDLDQTLVIIRNLIISDYRYTVYATSVSLSLLYFNHQNANKIINSIAGWAESDEWGNDRKKYVQDNLAEIFLFLFADQIKSILDEITGVSKDNENKESNESEDNKNDDASINIWLLLKELPYNEAQVLEKNIASLLILCFRHQKAKVVDRICDILEKYISQSKPSWTASLVSVLSRVKMESRTGGRYIRLILNRSSIKNNIQSSFRILLEE